MEHFGVVCLNKLKKMSKTKIIILSLLSAFIFFVIMSYDKLNNMIFDKSFIIKVILSLAFGFLSNIIFWKIKK